MRGLTEDAIQPGSQCRITGVGVRRWLGVTLVDRSLQSVTDLLDHTGSLAVDLRTREVGQLDRRNAGGDGFQRRPDLTLVEIRRNPGAVRAELGEDRLVEVTGGKAERLRGFAGAEV